MSKNNSKNTNPVRNFGSNGVKKKTAQKIWEKEIKMKTNNKKILRGIFLLAIGMAIIAWSPKPIVAQGDVWEQMADAPENVGEGGDLCYVGGDYIYAFRGDGTSVFWRYSISNDSWESMADAPDLLAEGSGLGYPGSGDYIYACRGWSIDFWRYSISNDSWESITSSPGMTLIRSLAYPGSGDYFYQPVGRYSPDFWRYSISNDLWDPLAEAPGDFVEHGDVTYGGGDYIYACSGTFGDCFRYSISDDSWDSMATAPGCGSDGFSLGYTGGDYIYAFSGGGSNGFWRYSISNNSWESMADAPENVYDGGALCYPGSGKHIYAFTGGGSTFCRYELPPEPVTVSVPDTTCGAPSGIVTILVNTEDLALFEVVSVEFDLTYDSGIITGIDVDTAGTLLSGTDWTCEYNVAGDTFSVTLAGTDTLVGSGTLIKLIFAVSPDAQPGDESPLHFVDFLFNEGNPPAITEDGIVIIVPFTTPMPPSDFSVYSDYTTPNSIQLTWADPTENIHGSPLMDLNHIDVYYSDGTFVASVNPGVETYTDDGLTDGQLYSYYLIAVTDNSIVSNPTDIISWHAGGSQVPSPPENLHAHSSGLGRIKLTWNDPTTQVDGTPLDDLAGINIYYADDNSFITSVEPGVETYTVSGLIPDQYYSFYVTAYDNEIPVNESEHSNTYGCDAHSFWYVHPDSTLNSIQVALNFCDDNDTVLVATCIYHENIVWPSTQGIKMISESGPDVTIIDGGLANASVIEILGVDSVIIQGFTIQEGHITNHSGGGIRIYNSSATLIDNTIQNNTAFGGGGLSIENYSSVTLTDNIIRNNESIYTYSRGGGLRIRGYSVVTCTSNVIQNNSSPWLGGGFYIGGSSVSLTDNLIEGNYAEMAGGGACVIGSYITIIGNEILNNDCYYISDGGGLCIESSDCPLIEDNIIEGNYAGNGGGIELWNNRLPFTIRNNLIKDNEGIMGGGIKVCNMRGEGFVIANNTIEGNIASIGGGIRIGCAQPTISGNKIIDNFANEYGGGIDIENVPNSTGLTHVSILDNIIENNHAVDRGGGLNITNMPVSLVYTPHIIGNTIRNNSAALGGGILLFYQDPSGHPVPANQFMDNIIQGNSAINGGGIGYLVYSPMAGTNNIIYDNSAVEYGGAIFPIDVAHQHQNLFTLEKSLISSNRSGHAGAVSLGNASCYLDSCFIVDNGSIDDALSGLAWVGSDADILKISNSNLYYNTFQPDVEIVNNTNNIIPLEHNFWWVTTALGIASLIQGPNDHEPWETDFIPEVPGEPTAIDSVGNYDNTYSQVVNFIIGDPDTLYLRIEGTDRLSSIREAAIAIIKSSIYPEGIAIALLETDKNSGIYEGKAVVKTSAGADTIRIDDIYQTIRVDESGDTITVTANMDSCKSCTVYYNVEQLFGAIEGTVTDAENGTIEGAVVTSRNTYTFCDTTDANGHYFMPAVLPDIYDMTVTAPGYNQFDTTGIVVLSGETTTVDFDMLHPEITVDPISFNVNINPGDTLNTTMYITNNGNGPLDFEILYTLRSKSLKGVDIKSAGKIPAGNNSVKIEPMMGRIGEPDAAISDIAPNALPWNGAKDTGDILWWYDVENPSGDNQCLGVEFDGTYYYVTGGNSDNNPNKIHFFDADGNYITSIDQPTSSDWGWRDIAYDGNYMYSSDDSYVTKWYVAGLPDNPVLEVVGNFPGPCSPNRALAYDPATDHFWTANYDSPIYEFDRSGMIINSFPNSYDIYGMAWDNVSPDGPWLWIFTQDYHHVRQFDPVACIYTGIVYEGYANNPDDYAGGACFAVQEGFGVFIGLTQSTPDLIFGMEICPVGHWLTVEPTSGTVPADETFEVTIHFDTYGLIPDSTYTTSILINNNSVDSLVTIPVTMYVTTVGVEDTPQIPKVFALNQNYPNPFFASAKGISASGGKGSNPQTTISYSLPKSCKVSLKIYNIKGQLVETLVDDVQLPGYHSVVWNAQDARSGVYLYRITAGDFTDTKKCVILK